MTIDIGTALRHYKRPEIQREMIADAVDKEVAARFGDSFGKRPDVLRNPGDVLELAKQGATSFHASEERWKNPLLLNTAMSRKELDNLRVGFDLVLDIDCKCLEYSGIAADLVVKALRSYGVRSLTVKFSGNKGFHIGVPFEAIPKKIGREETKLMFPEAAHRVAFYVREMIKKKLNKAILDFEGNDLARIIEKTGKKSTEITKTMHGIPTLDSEAFLDIDTLLISSRHLYRMPYSLHEKSGLVSVPISPSSILSFEKKSAIPSAVKAEIRFLDREAVKSEDAKEFFVQAFSQPFGEAKRTAKTETAEVSIPTTALPSTMFPPCIKKILEGLEDGKKRSVFILINFLTCSGWGYDDIEKLIMEWNKKNKEPLRDVYWMSQLKYHKIQKKKILPPNCANKAYYQDIRVCLPDERCRRITNPVNYAKRRQ